MRILIFHGYLLAGTGSNVYNARLAESLVRLGHEVHLLSQDRHPERLPFVDALGTWENDSLRVRAVDARQAAATSRSGSDPHGSASSMRPADSAAPGPGAGGLPPTARCTVYRPDIGGLLPVYVPDRYEGIEARAFLECSDAEVAAYVQANVDAVRELAVRTQPDLALANHLIMGPVILARGLPSAVPYAVKVHGSALEYTVKRDPQRFLAAAREGLARASAVLVGSRHTAESLWEALDDPGLPPRTRLGPPGVDVQRFVPRESVEAARGVRELIGRLSGGEQTRGGDAFARDEPAAAAALEQLGVADADPTRPLVVFVGKLIVSKGVDLLLASWPLVLERSPEARLLIVGFGAFKEALERLLAALARGDLVAARALAVAGRALELDPPAAGAFPLDAATGSGLESGATSDRAAGGSKSLRHLLAFLDSLSGVARERYLAAARDLPDRVALCGRLDHDELAEILPACDALVVPSTFPEAFGMVAAEAAACGVPPVSARHSGLAEVSDVLARALPAPAAEWLSFAVDDSAVPAISECVLAWLQADPQLRAGVRERLVEVVRERWSWEGVARGVIAAALGDLQTLEEPR